MIKTFILTPFFALSAVAAPATTTAPAAVKPQTTPINKPVAQAPSKAAQQPTKPAATQKTIQQAAKPTVPVTPSVPAPAPTPVPAPQPVVQPSITTRPPVPATPEIPPAVKPPVSESVKIPTPKIKHIVPKAVEIQVTPRGAKYFENNLSDLIGNLGLSLEEFYTPSIEWDSDAKDATDIDKLDVDPETQVLLGKIKKIYSEWLIGMPLKGIRPAIRLGDTAYMAQIKRMALTGHPELMKQLNKKSGAILALEMEVQEIDFATTKFRLMDLNNPWLGEVGLDNAKLKIGGDTAIRVRIPFYTQVNQQTGELEFEALQMEQNFNDINLELQYKKLIAPEFQLKVNKQIVAESNPERIEQEFRERLPDLLKMSRNILSRFASEQLPALLNKKAHEFLKGELEEAKEMRPPGAPNASKEKVQPFIWGLVLQQMNLNGNFSIMLNGYLEDLTNPNSALPRHLYSGQGAKVKDMDPKDYDVALALDHGLFNRIIQLCFERHYFDKIDISDPNDPNVPAYLQMVNAPIVSSPRPNERGPDDGVSTYIKARVRLKLPPGTLKDFYSKAAIREGFEPEFDVILKLEKDTPSGVKMVLWDAPVESLKFETKYMTGLGQFIDFFGNPITNIIKDKAVELVKNIRAKKISIGNLPLPPEIAGIRLQIQKMKVEDTGHFVMYMNYFDPVQNQSAGGDR